MPRDIRLGWDVETLNKAYRQGYMTGVMGMGRERCPYRGDVVIAAWEAGWDDGLNALDQQEKERRANPWIA